MSIDLRYLSLNGIGLEPLETKPPSVVKKAAVGFAGDARKKSERRKITDRRTELRFEENRRSNNDRRPLRTWEKGKNL
jgi:hypothetical protein